MEADSTTCENIVKSDQQSPCFPFSVHPGNCKYYLDVLNKPGSGSKENQLVLSLQSSRLIPAEVRCPKCSSDHNLKSKPARVVDRVQWVCESCGTKLPIRYNSFFYRVPCSLPHMLQLILAWCEDADYQIVAEKLEIKPKVVRGIYGKLDELIESEQKKCQLGGEGHVVLAEMYPDCLNRLSPDTTEQPHQHRILMLAATTHVPTRYVLHVIKEHKKLSNITIMDNKVIDNKLLENEISAVIQRQVSPNTTLVIGNYLPLIEGASTLQNLLQHCHTDMQHFLCERIWRQALTLCAASRDFCVDVVTAANCAVEVQRYLNSALYRLRYNDGFFQHVCQLVADQYTVNHGT